MGYQFCDKEKWYCDNSIIIIPIYFKTTSWLWKTSKDRNTKLKFV